MKSPEQELNPRARAHSVGKVHFDERQTATHVGDIQTNMAPDKKHVDAHLGFLQEKHKYEIRLVIPLYLGDRVEVAFKNANLQLTSVMADVKKTKHVLTMCLTAQKNGLINEEMVLNTADGSPFTVTVSARVLGRGKGTPLLKSGVRCLGVCEDYESDVSSVADET